MTPEQLKPFHDRLQDGLKPTEICIREGIVLEVGTSDYIRFGFEFFGWRSPEMVREMDAFVKYAKGKTCLLDIGAYHGIFSLVFTKMNERSASFAFEPFGEPFGQLLQNCANGNINCFQAAVSNNTGKINLFTGDGHLNKEKKYPDSVEYVVNAITGDSVCFGVFPNIEPDVIKIDVEGGELAALQGLNNIITKHRPVIFLELHYSVLTEDDVVAIMEIIGWFKYLVIDTETDTVIPLSSLLRQKQGEKRIVLK